MKRIWRHKKGGHYTEIGEAELEKTGERLTVYQDALGKTWARPHSEFHDGTRFVRVEVPPSLEAERPRVPRMQLVRQVLTWALDIARYERRTYDQIMNTPSEEAVKVIRARFEAEGELKKLTVLELELALLSVPE